MPHITNVKAREWRERLGMSRAQLGEAIGYDAQTIYWFERGMTPPGRGSEGHNRIKPWVWLRYMRACQGLDAELNKNAGAFQW